MELGLSLGDAKSTGSGGLSANVVDKRLGFCMALNGTSHQQMDKIHSQDDDHDDGDDDGEEQEKDDQLTLKQNGGISDIVIGSNRISSLNPPVQLDLLPSAPVPRHTTFPRSSENGSSEGGSSGNVVAGRRFDARKKQSAVGTEEATSSFRLEFKKENHKRGFVFGNEAVDVERASDEEDNGMSRKKLRLSKEQSAYLEQTFKEHNTLNPKQKIALAEQLNLTPRQVEVWFQNRRARTKLKQTELDYEYLKRCCETLTEENRRLHKELQEIRALKTTANPFYMQLPATTLTMCPSCERVDSTSIKNGSRPLTHSPKPMSLNSPVSYVPQSSNSRE